MTPKTVDGILGKVALYGIRPDTKTALKELVLGCVPEIKDIPSEKHIRSIQFAEGVEVCREAMIKAIEEAFK